jgi:hypothetical protein
MRVLLVFPAILIIAACSSSDPERVDSTNPTITYKYFGETYGSQFDEISGRAASYCNEQFGRAARLKNVDPGNDENFAVFECV